MNQPVRKKRQLQVSIEERSHCKKFLPDSTLAKITSVHKAVMIFNDLSANSVYQATISNDVSGINVTDESSIDNIEAAWKIGRRSVGLNGI